MDSDKKLIGRTYKSAQKSLMLLSSLFSSLISFRAARVEELNVCKQRFHEFKKKQTFTFTIKKKKNEDICYVLIFSIIQQPYSQHMSGIKHLIHVERLCDVTSQATMLILALLYRKVYYLSQDITIDKFHRELCKLSTFNQHFPKTQTYRVHIVENRLY